MTDPIADCLTRIRNAQKAKHVSVSVSNSSIKVKILEILKDNGFINGFELKKNELKRPMLVVDLKYHQSKPAIYSIKRISKPGMRIYSTQTELKKKLSVIGLSIVTTSKGIMTDKMACEQGLGGEVICSVS